MKQMSESDIHARIQEVTGFLLRSFMRIYTSTQVDPGDEVRPPHTGDRVRISIEMENPDPEKMLSKLTSETYVDLSEVEVVS